MDDALVAPLRTSFGNRAARGADNAVLFEELYQEQYPAMVRVAFGLVGDLGLAEELTQEAFTSVYRRFDQLEDPLPYLRVCVLNAAKRYLKRSHRSRHEPLTTDHEPLFEPSQEFLLDVVRRLPQRHRDVVVLKYQLGLSEAEMAKTLGVPVGSIKSRLHRAKRELRRELRDE